MFSKLRCCCWFASAVVVVLIGSHASADWPRFRGPNGSGVSDEGVPTAVTWSDGQNIKWKIPLPGPGSSSPIVIGDRVLLTYWSGYGVDREHAGEQENLVRHLICVDRKTGTALWSRDVKAVLPEDHYEGMFAEHGYASHTPVSDGEKVFVFFGKSGVHAFDLDGNPLWQSQVGSGSDPRGWGSASSPILYKNLVIVTASAEDEAIVAFDQQTGQEVWRQKAGGLSGTWGTPILVDVDENRTDLVIGVPYEIWGLNPDNGKLRWFCPAMETDSFCSSLIAEGDVVFGIEGRGGGSIAVRVGGKDDVSATHVVWKGQDRNQVGTPVIHNGRIYFISNKVVNCINASTAESVYQSRLTGGASRSGNASGDGAANRANGGSEQPRRGRGRGGRGGSGFGGFGGQDYASPVAADGKLYYVTRSGDVYVLKLGDTFEQLAVNRMTEESEDFSATPAVSDGDLFIRSSKHLYCIGPNNTGS